MQPVPLRRHGTQDPAVPARIMRHAAASWLVQDGFPLCDV